MSNSDKKPRRLTTEEARKMLEEGRLELLEMERRDWEIQKEFMEKRRKAREEIAAKKAAKNTQDQ